MLLRLLGRWCPDWEAMDARLLGRLLLGSLAETPKDSLLTLLSAVDACEDLLRLLRIVTVLGM